ncbi:magnesium transporter MgtE N-terminal domain-containing protein [Micromonospora aurantiaca (nom. illeg.)]|uniref:magnesium transporter MgtE N-terminal domain-containing protein n=1 Tax=Micromonospora aurantiaca (nom. illeg.) TaxID=47850 RepID=UPI0033C10851
MSATETPRPTGAEKLPVEDVVGQLADMPASDAARRLDAVPAARAVEVLTEMDDEVAGDIPGAMQRTAAAAALTTMPPAVAAELLLRTQYDERVGILSQLSAEAAPVIFAEMPDRITVLAQSGVAPDKVVQFLANMPIDGGDGAGYWSAAEVSDAPSDTRWAVACQRWWRPQPGRPS